MDRVLSGRPSCLTMKSRTTVLSFCQCSRWLLACVLFVLNANTSQAWIAGSPFQVTPTRYQHIHKRKLGSIPSLGLYPKAAKSYTTTTTTTANPTALEVFTHAYQNATASSSAWWVEELAYLEQNEHDPTVQIQQQAQGIATLGMPLTEETMYHTTALSTPLVHTSHHPATTATFDHCDNQKATLLARLLLIGAAALYGTNFSLVKLMGESDIPIGLSSTIRFGMAALVTSPWLFATNRNKAKTTAATTATTASLTILQSDDNNNNDAWSALWAGFEVGLWNSIGYISQAVGLEATDASVSAFLCSLAVVVVPFLDAWSGKQLRARQWIGAILALAGVANLELGHGVATGTLSAGEMASMLQPLAFGFGFFRLERAMHQYPAEGKRATAAQLAAVFLGCIAYTATMETVTIDQLQSYLMDPANLALFFWTGVISTALSVYMESVALMTLTAAETTLLLSTEPLWGALWAALLVGEQLGADTFIGGFLILTACLYSSLGWDRLQNLVMGNKSGNDSSFSLSSHKKNPG